MENLTTYFDLFMPGLNRALDEFTTRTLKTADPMMLEIFQYHLGLQDQSQQQGKRLRPLLVLLCAQGSGNNWMNAMPAAVAVELLHNFSLIHDDIEDNGLLRRGREAVWVKWGMPLALNAGDAMFASAFSAINELNQVVGCEKSLQAAELLSATSMQLTNGQHLDLVFEESDSIDSKDYFCMIAGKTAALFACCTQMGALIGGLNMEKRELYGQFGYELGISFQIYDDWLGIWGEAQQTGKSSSSDLVEGKKSLPVIWGLEQSLRFKRRWVKGQISDTEAVEMAQFLREDGVELCIKEEFLNWHNNLKNTLNKLDCIQSVKSALAELGEQLSIRAQ